MSQVKISIEVDAILSGDRQAEVRFDDTVSSTKTFSKKLKLALEAVDIDPISVAKDIIRDDEAKS